MKTSPLLLLLLIATSAAAADVQINDTYDQVISAKGSPAGQMKTSSSQVLQYPDATIKLVDGHVTSITAPAPKRSPAPVVNTPAKEAAPRAPECSIPEAGFEAQLSSVVPWQVIKQAEGTSSTPYVRQIASGAREIIVVIGPDPRPAGSFQEFVAAWKRGLPSQPAVKVVAEDTRMFDHLQAAVLDTQSPISGGVRYCRCIIAKADSVMYNIIARSDKEPVSDDNVLMAFLNSIRIRPKKV